MDLLATLRTHAQRLSQRNLSVLGRGLVANSLLLSRLWHSTRVLPLTQSYLLQARSIIIKFLSHRTFPAVSFATCTRSRREGGLAVLDPLAQHSAVKLCWLLPLLIPSRDTSTSFLPAILRYCLAALCSAPSHLLPLVFPTRRSSDLTALSSMRGLLTTVDQMGLQINWRAFNASMVEELPLTIVCPGLQALPPDVCHYRWDRVLVKDAYCFDESRDVCDANSCRSGLLIATRYSLSLNHYAMAIVRSQTSSVNTLSPLTRYHLILPSSWSSSRAPEPILDTSCSPSFRTA